ncbi:hypothetical protein O3P69_006247 [Scylla paramamosain]|uniref:Uncharacterized protein n=1 Tax=Scylla paramamosain TaxID=85552 RepID=A0AAW0U614_SCYPA
MKVNDDMHMSPSDIEYEYIVPAIPVLALKDESVASHVTCGELQTFKELFDLLNREFSIEDDDKTRRTLYTCVGSEEDPSWTVDYVSEREGSKRSNEILSGSVGSSTDRFTTQTKYLEEHRRYVVPHNPNLIFAAARNEPKQLLAGFLASEWITDNESVKEWFTLSDYWLEMDANVMYSLYGSKMVVHSSKRWINWKTSQTIPTGNEYYDAVSQAVGAFVLYKKEAFVKKGIPSSTKLKSMQSLFTRNLPDEFFDKDSEYNKSAQHTLLKNEDTKHLSVIEIVRTAQGAE